MLHLLGARAVGFVQDIGELCEGGVSSRGKLLVADGLCRTPSDPLGPLCSVRHHLGDKIS